MATHSSVLAWRIPGTGSLVGCRLWGRTESDRTKATQQQQQQHICTVFHNLMVIPVFSGQSLQFFFTESEMNQHKYY